VCTVPERPASVQRKHWLLSGSFSSDPRRAWSLGASFDTTSATGTTALANGTFQIVGESVVFKRDPYGRVRSELLNGATYAAHDIAYYDNGMVRRINNVHYERDLTTGLVGTIRFAPREDPDLATYAIVDQAPLRRGRSASPGIRAGERLEDAGFVLGRVTKTGRKVFKRPAPRSGTIPARPLRREKNRIGTSLTMLAMRTVLPVAW
jgi:hypothetical protein